MPEEPAQRRESRSPHEAALCAPDASAPTSCAAQAAIDEAPNPTAANSRNQAAQPFSEAEEEALQARAEEPDPQVAGGAMSNQHLTYAVIALAAIVLVLIAK
jgi:hypothetical protein